jgi:hypothetical protein
LEKDWWSCIRVLECRERSGVWDCGVRIGRSGR